MSHAQELDFVVGSGGLLVPHEDGLLLLAGGLLLLLLADRLVVDVRPLEQEHQPHSRVEDQHWKIDKINGEKI